MRPSASIVAGAASLVAIALVAGAAGGCSGSSCPPGTSRSDVRADYGSTDEFVCVPVVGPDDGGPPASGGAPAPPLFAPSTPPPTAPPTADGGGAAAPACGSGAPGDLDVRLIERNGASPATGGAPPDGDYILARATLHPADASDSGVGPPWTALRATMRVAGALLELTAEETAPSAGPVESLTATVGGGALVKVCATPGGPIASSLLAGPPGATARASLGWDGATLDLVVVTSFGSMDLVFVTA